MSEQPPKWLPSDVADEFRSPGFPSGSLKHRLCKSVEMRHVWEWFSAEYAPKDSQKSDHSKYGIITSESEPLRPKSGLHFLHLLTLPVTDIGTFGKMTPDARKKKLSAIAGGARRLKQQLDGAPFVQPYLKNHDLVPFDKSEISLVEADIANAAESASFIGFSLTIAYKVNPDGTLLKHDPSYPESALPEILDELIYWCESYGQDRGFLENLPVIRHGGIKAKQNSYLATLERYLTLAEISLEDKHYASILNTVFDLDSGGLTDAAVRHRLNDIRKRCSESDSEIAQDSVDLD